MRSQKPSRFLPRMTAVYVTGIELFVDGGQVQNLKGLDCCNPFKINHILPSVD